MRISIIVIVVLAIIVIADGGVYNYIFERGSVTGEFVVGEHHGFGDECGQYPASYVKLRNWSKNGEIYGDGRGRFYFGNQFEEIDKCVPGCIYKFSYHMETRPSDVNAMNTIKYYVIESMEKLP